MIQDSIEYLIYENYCALGKEPMSIVMHPATWEKLVDEAVGGRIDYINIHHTTLYNNNLTYKGYRILRSFDIAEGEIELTSQRYTE